MARPMLVALDMAEHDRHRAPQADAVRRFHDLQPFGGLDLVGADDRADLVVEDLGGGAGQGAEPGVAQFAQEIGEAAAERLGALPHFEGREGMDMHARHRLLDRAADPEIGSAGIFRMDAALQADFGGAALPGFLDAADDLVHIEVVGPAAQILAELALREGAELAAEIADVGVVDVAGDDVGDGVARLTARRSWSAASHTSAKLVAARLEQADDVGFGQRRAGGRAIEDVVRAPHPALPPRAGRGTVPARICGVRRLPLPAAGRGFGWGLGGVRCRRRGSRDRGGRGLGRRPRAAPRCAASDRASAPGPARKPDRSPAARPAACRRPAVRRAKRSSAGHGASGLTWSGVTGDTPPQSLIPAAIISSSASGIRLGGAWMFICRPEDQPGDGDRPQMVGLVGLGRRRHARAGLGPEILDDDFLDVAVALVEIAQRQQRLDALDPGLADADEDPRGERHRRLAGRRDRREPPRRRLVGRAEMRPAAARQALGGAFQHDPLRHRDRAQPLDLVPAHDAGIEMRQEPGFLQHQRRHFGEIGERRVVAEPRRAPRAPRGSAVRACRPA